MDQDKLSEYIGIKYTDCVRKKMDNGIFIPRKKIEVYSEVKIVFTLNFDLFSQMVISQLLVNKSEWSEFHFGDENPIVHFFLTQSVVLLLNMWFI